MIVNRGKPLYKLTKFKIVRVTDHTYVTDNGKVYRKNHICLKPNYRSTVSVAPNTLGDCLQTSNSTSRDAIKRPLTRSQPVLLEQRPNNPTLSTPMVDLTVDSSSKARLDPTVVFKRFMILLLSENARGFSVTHLRSGLLLSLTLHRSSTLQQVLPARYRPPLPQNLKVR